MSFFVYALEMWRPRKGSNDWFRLTHVVIVLAVDAQILGSHLIRSASEEGVGSGALAVLAPYWGK